MKKESNGSDELGQYFLSPSSLINKGEEKEWKRPHFFAVCPICLCRSSNDEFSVFVVLLMDLIFIVIVIIYAVIFFW